MGRYRRIEATVDAQQWRRIGDLALDKPLILGEGRIVKSYHRDNIDDSLKCVLCGQLMKNHGWIDPPAAPLDPSVAAIPVNPMTGEQVEVPVIRSGAAKTYKKEGSDDRLVHDDVEEKQAISEGYSLVETALPPAPDPTYSGFPKAIDPIEVKDRTGEGTHYTAGTTTKGFDENAPSAPRADAPTDQNDEKTHKRKDLEGLVVCPNDWVITYPGGERECCKPDLFIHTWTKD